jgi:hypothetical protein
MARKGGESLVVKPATDGDGYTVLSVLASVLGLTNQTVIQSPLLS